MYMQPQLTGACDAATAQKMTAAGAAWNEAIDANAVANAADGLAPIVTDERPGTVVGRDSMGTPVISRKRRWDLGQDILMSPNTLAGLRSTYNQHRQRAPIHLGADAGWKSRNGGYDVMSKYPTVEMFLQHGLADDLAVEALMPAEAVDAPSLYVHLDLVLQLPELIELSRVPTTARSILPMHNFNAPGATDYEYKVTEKRGRAEFTAEFDGRAPESGRDVKPIRRPLVWMWAGASWSWLDVQNAAMARRNGAQLPGLENDLLMIARENLRILEDLTMFFGQSSLGLHGVLSPQSDTLITRTNAPKNFSDPGITAEEMLKVLKDAEKRVFKTRFETPDTIALGTSDFIAVHQKELDLANSSNMTVAKHFLASSMHVKQIVWAPMLDYVPEVEAELNEQGYEGAEAERYAGGINKLPVMLMYRRDPGVMRGITAADLQVMPTEQASLRFYTPVLHKTGGLEVRRPRGADLTLFPAVGP